MIAYSAFEKSECILEGKSVIVDGFAFEIRRIVNVPIKPGRRLVNATLVFSILAIIAFICLALFGLYDRQATAGERLFLIALTLFADATFLALLVLMLQMRTIFRGCRSQWIINEGKTFWVESNDDPTIENKLRELVDPALASSRYRFFPQPRVRKLYLALPVPLAALMLEVLCAPRFVSGAGWPAACMLAVVVGMLGAAVIILNQRFREMRWKPYAIRRERGMRGEMAG